jgi:hypothetical protein
MVALIINGQRYMIICLVTYAIVYSLRFKFSRVFGFTLFGLIIFSTLMQDLKNYGESFDLLGYLELTSLFEKITTNFAPIYLTSFLYLDNKYSAIALLGDMIPGYKMLSGQYGLVDFVSYQYLPNELLEEGSRLGSNSSLLFSEAWLTLVLIITPTICAIRFFMTKLRIFNQVLICYLVMFAPYAIRRSILSYLFDILCFAVFCIIIYGCKKIFQLIRFESALVFLSSKRSSLFRVKNL